MSSNSPLVSIVINCFNGEKYLKETIESVLNQSYNNWEIIFWDNQSTDGSAKIIKNYLDKRIKYYKSYLHTPLGKARNLAMEHAAGEWCAFLDCDDLWLPNKLQKQIDIILSDCKNIGLVYGRMSVISEKNRYQSYWSNRMIRYDNKKSMKNLPEGRVFDELLQLNFIPLLTAIFRRDLFNQIGGISDHMEIAEDYDLFVKLSYLTNVCAVQEVVALYRVHDNNYSIGKQKQGFLETIEIVGRHLPAQSAVRALKAHHTIRSIQQIREGEVLGGITRLLFNGSLVCIFSILYKK